MSHFLDIIKFINRSSPRTHIEYIERALINLYSYPKRAYHNWDHVEVCLHELDAVELPGIDPYKNLISIAIYYHDCIYDPENMDNEERSAERAFMDLLALNISPSYAQWVYDHIMLTTHKESCKYLSGQILMDIDFSILGKDADIFQAYENGICQEFSFVQDKMYRLQRVKFMKSLLDRNVIYQTEYFQDKYEKTARENIKNCIQELTFNS
jgi:predicted metal-dependent HD superfamily phosphohydrolase